MTFEELSAPEGRVTLSRAQTLYQDGLSCARTGRYEEAIRLIREALRLEPEMLEAVMDLGMVLHTMERFPEAIQAFEKAVGIAPTNPGVYNNLGRAFMADNKMTEAQKCFDQACKLDPNHVKALFNKACLWVRQAKYEEAETLYRQVIALEETFYPAHQELAHLLKHQGRMEDAIAHYESAIRLEPDAVECVASYHALGIIWAQRGDLPEAVHYYQQALRLDPDCVAAYYNLGGAFVMQGQYKSASVCYEKAMQLDPDLTDIYAAYADVMRLMGRYELAVHYYQKSLDKGYIEAQTYSSMGLCFTQLRQFERAKKCLDKAKSLDSNLSTAYYNTGLFYEKQRQWDDARREYESVRQIIPQPVRSAMRLGILDLMFGRYKTGWPKFERRLADNIFYPLVLQAPLWDGQASLKGKTIVVVGEIFLGDTLQFLRYLPKLKRKGAWVVLACPEEWHGVLENCPGVDAVIPLTRDRLDGAYDYAVYPLSLPMLFQTEVDTVPAPGKPIKPDLSLKRAWKKNLSVAKGLKIGLYLDMTHGLPEFQQALRVILDTGTALGANFFDVRPGSDRPQSSESGQSAVVQLGPALHQLDQWLAVMANMDLIIATDSATVHVAALLGKPVWLLLDYDHHWRWMLKRKDSPWYPTLRLFRQEDPEQWQPVFKSVLSALKKAVKNGLG